jgi:hypothetical protein
LAKNGAASAIYGFDRHWLEDQPPGIGFELNLSSCTERTGKGYKIEGYMYETKAAHAEKHILLEVVSGRLGY